MSSEDIIQLQSAYVERMRTAPSVSSFEYESLDLLVHPGVFPPYVDGVLVADTIRVAPGERWLDACTGSGLIGLVAASRGAQVTVTDINPRAVDNALENAEKLGIREQFSGAVADVFPPPDTPYDVITINPPYSDHAACDLIERSVWDPGNQVLYRFLAGLPDYLAQGGRAYLGWADFANLSLVALCCKERGIEARITARRRDEHSEFVVFELAIT
ncbi:MAG: RsmD family RNA methyltransferase [Pseudomonadota bacterium]